MAEAEVQSVVMTVGGPLAPEDVPVGPVLCREWLLADQAALLVAETAGLDGSGDGGVGCPKAGSRVELSGLAVLRRWPLCALHNLSLSKDDVLQEISGPFKRRHSGGLVMVSTPRPFWGVSTPQDWAAALLALQKDACVQLVSGTSPAPGRPASPSNEDIEVEVAKLVSDLAVGYEGSTQVRPGFIGELLLHGPSADATELLSLLTCVEAQRRCGAPLLLSGPVSAEAFAILDGSRTGVSGPCLWERCAFFDVPIDSPVPVGELVRRGAYAGFCPPPCCGETAWASYAYQRPWRTEEAFFEGLAVAPAGRALLGSGLRFRTDLTAFGGPGLSYAADLVGAAGSPGCCLPPRSSAAVMAGSRAREAAIGFLQYPWKPPPPPEVAKACSTRALNVAIVLAVSDCVQTRPLLA
eukprot:TRINITY_DN6599_c0_g1_i2.p1 TRINITY_DN6599_c0_g1~~TRINITY_DN6599_c0_g1_i2.p1  ORF type:complete len:410 (+),score=58.61 TRINITY_DN6599_c0_g1_i2:246-1475(+)